MADRIVVLNAGHVEQYGTPMELYRTPANRFVAGFIGSPKMNFIDGAEAARHGAHSIGVRPEHLHIGTDGGTWAGKVQVVEHLGSDTFVYVNVDGLGLVTVRVEGEEELKPGQTVHLTPDPAHIYRFDKAGVAIR
jgi:multiple sugar transport system ATP-binding protein